MPPSLYTCMYNKHRPFGGRAAGRVMEADWPCIKKKHTKTNKNKRKRVRSGGRRASRDLNLSVRSLSNFFFVSLVLRCVFCVPLGERINGTTLLTHLDAGMLTLTLPDFPLPRCARRAKIKERKQLKRRRAFVV